MRFCDLHRVLTGKTTAHTHIYVNVSTVVIHSKMKRPRYESMLNPIKKVVFFALVFVCFPIKLFFVLIFLKTIKAENCKQAGN